MTADRCDTNGWRAVVTIFDVLWCKMHIAKGHSHRNKRRQANVVLPRPACESGESGVLTSLILSSKHQANLIKFIFNGMPGLRANTVTGLIVALSKAILAQHLINLRDAVNGSGLIALLIALTKPELSFTLTPADPITLSSSALNVVCLVTCTKLNVAVETNHFVND